MASNRATKEKGELVKMLSVIHTGPVTVEPLKRLSHEILPGIRVVNIVDDSLLKDVMDAGRVTKEVTRRMCQYMMSSQDMGADVILNACSSVGEVVDVARNLVSIPIVKIDESMAEEAVSAGSAIGVVATVPTTLDPTVRLIERKAQDSRKKVLIKRALCSGAFEALISGNPEKHDEFVRKHVEDISREVDVVVLAQASMARLAPKLANRIGVPVLASPRLGVESVKKVIDTLR